MLAFDINYYIYLLTLCKYAQVALPKYNYDVNFSLIKLRSWLQICINVYIIIKIIANEYIAN